MNGNVIKAFSSDFCVLEQDGKYFVEMSGEVMSLRAYNDCCTDQIEVISNFRDWLLYNDFDVSEYDSSPLTDACYLAQLDCDYNKDNLILV